MFSTVNRFQTFKPGGGKRVALQIQTREPIKRIKLYQTALTGNDKRRHCVHQKHAKQQNETLQPELFIENQM